MRSVRRVAPYFLIIHGLLAGCALHAPVAVHATKATSDPTVTTPAVAALAPLGATLTIKQLGAQTLLTGKVEVISDNGGGVAAGPATSLVSDVGSGVISNNSGSLLSNNGAGVISNQGAQYGLLTAAASGSYRLSDAVITLQQADGTTLVDEHGKPLTATTDATGTYKLSAVLPNGNVVLHLDLHSGGLLKGGELLALAPKGDAPVQTQPIDTASSLGAAYVLGSYVKGSQTTFDKLPASEADSLYADIAGARNPFTTTIGYSATQLLAETETLRGAAAPVSKRLDEIKALLLGQAHLGAGRPSNTVPIVKPAALAEGADGALLIGEAKFGRIRSIDAQGYLTTYADVVNGAVKQNFTLLNDILRLPDGSILVSDPVSVFRIGTDGKVSNYAGNGLLPLGAVDVLATQTSVQPQRLALGPDGTVYIAEARERTEEGGSRILKIGADDKIHVVPLAVSPIAGDTVFNGLLVEQDGSFDVLVGSNNNDLTASGLFRFKPDGTKTQLLSGLTDVQSDDNDLARGPDGTLYVSQSTPPLIKAVGPDGQTRVVLGAGAPAGAPSLLACGHILARADGTLVVADYMQNLVWERSAAGSWQPLAGIAPGDAARADLDNLALNAPSGAAFDATGALVLSETGGNVLRRFDGTTVATIAGSKVGFSGDGGPATAATFQAPTGLAIHGTDTYVIDSDNNRLRKISADGTIQTVAGGGSDGSAFAVGDRRPASSITIKDGHLAIDSHGRPYWTAATAQILRLADDGMVELVAGGAGHTQNGRDLSTDPNSITQFLGKAVPASGLASDAVFVYPGGLAFDGADNLYAADTAGFVVVKIAALDTPKPTIALFAGVGLGATLGSIDQFGTDLEDGTAATAAHILSPGGLAADAAGNVYIGEMGTVALSLVETQDGSAFSGLTRDLPPVYARLRKVGLDGKIKTLAGPGTRFFPNPLADDGLVMPLGLALAPDGRLAVADVGANLVRILPAGSY